MGVPVGMVPRARWEAAEAECVELRAEMAKRDARAAEVVTELRRVAGRVVAAFEAHGKSRDVTTDLQTRAECENSLVALRATLTKQEAP